MNRGAIPGRLLIAATALASLTAFAPAPFPDPGKGEPKQWEGRWTMTRHGGNGNFLLPAPIRDVAIKGKTWTLSGSAASGLSPLRAKYTVTLDQRTTPRSIDMQLNGGEVALRGIYRLQGEEVEILIHPAAVKIRPGGFDYARNDAYRFYLKRDKAGSK